MAGGSLSNLSSLRRPLAGTGALSLSDNPGNFAYKVQTEPHKPQRYGTMDIVIREELPSADEYRTLRRIAGWGDIPKATAGKALASTAISLCARRDTKLVGLGRVVGDNALYFYVSDVVVHPDERGSGLGNQIIQGLVARVRDVAEPGASVAVLAAPGREEFYEQAGFKACPNAYFGQGLAYLEPIERLFSGSN